jgi:hypothetical protein
LAAVVAILRFQEIYELDTVRLARGESGADNFTVTNSSIAVMPLSAEDCLELGQMAHALGVRGLFLKKLTFQESQ